MPDRNRDQRPPRARACKVGPDPLDPSQKHRQGRLHWRAIGLQAEEIRRKEWRGGNGVRQSEGAAALYVRRLALRALPQMHGARQDRCHQGNRRVAHLAAGMDHAICRWRPNWFFGSSQGTHAVSRCPRRYLPGRGKSRVLRGAFLSAAALSARSDGHWPQSRVAPARDPKVTFFGSCALIPKKTAEATEESVVWTE